MIAYFDLYSGAAGDMILGSLIDAGFQIATLREALASLPVGGYSISADPVQKGALGATAFHVECSESQPERTLAEILSIIDRSSIPENVKKSASQVFSTLGEAEARVHRVPIERIHFHEVGAIDAIVDIVGTCLALHLLGITAVYVSPFPVALGSHHAAHGWLPLPGPATLEILASVGAPVCPAPDETGHELVTPTGAALLCTLGSFEQPSLLLRKVGYGAGALDLPHPNVLRVWMGEPVGPSRKHEHDACPGSDGEDVALLETNLDDMDPQVYGHVMDRLFDSGALDVFLTPLVMKKSRPGTMLSVLCRNEDVLRLNEVMLRETTTLGVRVQSMRRATAQRSQVAVDTVLGPVRVKVKQLDGRAVAAKPEYDDCVALARRHDRPLLEILDMARQAAEMLVER